MTESLGWLSRVEGMKDSALFKVNTAFGLSKGSKGSLIHFFVPSQPLKGIKRELRQRLEASQWLRLRLLPDAPPSQYLRLRLASEAEPLIMIIKSPICAVCKNLDRELINPCDNPKLKHLQRSSRSGCVYCTLLCQTRKIFNMDKELSVLTFWTGSEPLRISGFSCNWYFNISLCPQVDPWGSFSKSEDFPTTARSNETISFYKEMFQQCLMSHDECRTGQSALPTRLLFLGNRSNPMRIVETDAIEVRSYAALSHCWGSSKNLELTSATEALMKCSIGHNSLPQTYRDAVFVCQQLELCYLWIDSLCIKQDDGEDWSREAAKMADVYENAHIVIAASCCQSGEGSFLESRDLSNGGPTVIAWNDNQEPKPLLQVRKMPSVGIHNRRPTHKADRENTDPLDTRAWAFQEARLAKRLLKFTSQEVQWCCKRVISCECGQKLRGDDQLWASSVEDDKIGTQDLTEDWFDAVGDFSSRDLTYPSDKLPALSGLAARFHLSIGANYIAGLWQNDHIAQQLSWYVCRGSQPTRIDYDRTYRAPTFSWASLDARIAWPSSMEWRSENQVKILDASCAPKDKNPFGEVCDGYLRVQGRALRLTMHQPSRKWSRPSFRLDNKTIEMWVLGFDKDFFSTFFQLSALPTDSTVRPARSLTWHKEVREDLPPSIPVLLLRLWAKTDIDDHQGCSLILTQSVYVPGAYERIGVWDTEDWPSNRNVVKKLNKLWDSTLPEELLLV